MDLPLRGIYFKDTVPPNPDRGFYIINLQSEADPRNGTHWTCFYYDGLTNLYYDSFGFPAPEELEEVIFPYIYNDRDIQDIKSSSCGYYCIAFIIYLYRYGAGINSFEAFINLQKIQKETI